MGKQPGAADKKHEGHSNLQVAVEAQMAKGGKKLQRELKESYEEEYITNLHKQIALMEHELECLKQREVEQKNKAQGYEVLLRDKIPLNEHFLALKNKYNVEWEGLKKEDEFAKSEIKKEERDNDKKEHQINIKKNEYEKISEDFQTVKESTLSRMKELEHKLFIEQHTRDILKDEKQVLLDKVGVLKQDNQNKTRQITKDRYHNDKDEVRKKRKETMDDLELQIKKLSEQVEEEQAELEREIERNQDP